MTRGNVIIIGFLTLALGGLFYAGFRLIGLEGVSSGIAAEGLLVMIVVFWTSTYLVRVVTGNMTFMEQRRRYRKAYEEMTTAEIESKFASMSEEEQVAILENLQNPKGPIQPDRNLEP